MKIKDWNKLSHEEKTKLLSERIHIIDDVFGPPFQAIMKVVDYEYEFVIGRSPKEEVISDKEPPGKLGERADIIPIDGYLGLYEPTRATITIFNRGIERASETIKCNFDFLKRVVRLHEWSHALVHVGFSKDKVIEILKNDKLWDELFAEATKVYLSIEDRLHEHIAQLLTYHSLILIRQSARYEESKKVFDRMVEIFLELNKRQPSHYRIDKYLNIPWNRIFQSINLLKKEWLKGVFEAWDTVIEL